MFIDIPNEALPFILLQRTGLQRLNFRFLRKLGVSYHPRLCAWECRWRGAVIRRDFASSILHDYEQIRAHLPERAGTILDIGCGEVAEEIQSFEANEQNTIPLGDGSVDLVLSLISWGFHYPVATYLQEAVRVLAPGGTLILDVRRDSGGLEELRADFPKLTTISEQPKFLRVCGRK